MVMGVPEASVGPTVKVSGAPLSEGAGELLPAMVVTVTTEASSDV
jgi:hypothetical protein